MKNKGFIQYHKNGTGFTLIELLVAMTVMAVLIAVGLVSYQGAKKAARDGKRKADLEQIRSALEIYRSDCKTYPLALGTQLKGVYTPPAACSTSDVYMEQVPVDPGSCSYSYSSSTNSYVLCASQENLGVGSSVTGCGSCGGAGCPCNYKVINP